MSFQIDVKVDERWGQFSDKLKNAGPSIRAIVRETVQKSAYEVEAEAKPITPIDTGRLRSSIATSLDTSTQGMKAYVGSDVEYAEAVHEGTQKHKPPTSSKFLELGLQKAQNRIADAFDEGLERITEALTT